jgi:DNA polymerase V
LKENLQKYAPKFGIYENTVPVERSYRYLFHYDSEKYEKRRRLDEVIDRINRKNGSDTIVLGSQQYTSKDGKKITAGVFHDSIKHDFRSPSYTTKWSDIPEAE